MGLVIDWIIVNCEDVERMSAFWSAALDFEHVRTGPFGGHVLAAMDGSKRRLAMFPVSERKGGQEPSSLRPSTGRPRRGGAPPRTARCLSDRHRAG